MIPSHGESTSFIEDHNPTVGIGYTPIKDYFVPLNFMYFHNRLDRITEGVCYCHSDQDGIPRRDDRVLAGEGQLDNFLL